MCARKIGHEHNLCQAQKAQNTDPRTNYAVKYATARGHLRKTQELWGQKKHKTHKHFAGGPCGTSVPGTIPSHPRDKWDKMAILLWK